MATFRKRNGKWHVQIRKPKPDKPRDRRLNPDELELLLKSSKHSWSICLEPLVILA